MKWEFGTTEFLYIAFVRSGGVMTCKSLRDFLLVAGMACGAALLPAQTIQVNQNNRTVAVTAIDKAAADADVATVHVGFVQYAATADDAYAAGSQLSNSIIAALRKAGIAERAIESEGQFLRENFQFDEKETEADRAKRRFVLNQSWIVKSSADDAAKVLHIAVQAGANNSGQIDWGLKDREALRAEAAGKALTHARAIAEQMAKGLNAHLGSLVYASNREPEILGEGIGSGFGGGIAAGVALEQKALTPLAIRAPKIEESATVYAVFAIE